METININGKEYTKKALLDGIYRNDHDVSGLFETLCTFPRLEPAPPKLRPMSELPELNEKHYLFAFANVYNLKEIRYVSLCRINPVGILASWSFNFKTKGYLSLCENYILLGWLFELPNPNDIKL